MNRSRTWPWATVLACMAFATQDVWAVCSFQSSNEPSLQSSFNSLFGGAGVLSATNDCLDDGTGANRDGAWSTQGRTSATILLELAGFANRNRFGIYDILNPANRIEVFDGLAGAGESAALSFVVGPGGVTVAVTRGSQTTTSASPFLSEAFGFFLRTPQGNVFFSQSELNVSAVDRMYAYRGNGAVFAGGPAVVVGSVFGVNDAILAYEDLVNGDNDFQDFVVLVRGVAPIPLPAAALLLLSALGGFAALRRGNRTASA